MLNIFLLIFADRRRSTKKHLEQPRTCCSKSGGAPQSKWCNAIVMHANAACGTSGSLDWGGRRSVSLQRPQFFFGNFRLCFAHHPSPHRSRHALPVHSRRNAAALASAGGGLALELGLPADCTLGKDCFLQQFPDMQKGQRSRRPLLRRGPPRHHDGVDLRSCR